MIKNISASEYNKTGYLRYGFNRFSTEEIKSIHQGPILIPQGDTWQESQARKAADKLVECLDNSDNTDNIKYYSMVCDAVRSDFPNSPVEILTDKNNIPVTATHIVGKYGSKLAVIPSVLASYEDVIKAVAKSMEESPNIIDVSK